MNNITLTPAQPQARDFAHVEHWVFDLDNTLYPPACDLFAQIDQRMTEFISSYLELDMVEARLIQKDFYVKHGTTLAGLMEVHGLEPGKFLAHVHKIDVSVVVPDPALGRAIAALPGTKVVFTNGSVAHAENVLTQLGIADVFTGIYDIVTTGYAPKPARLAYDRFVAASGIAPARAAMFEDIPRNLIVPHELGMKTVWVRPDEPSSAMAPERYQQLSHEGGEGPHIHHATDDLKVFLETLAR